MRVARWRGILAPSHVGPKRETHIREVRKMMLSLARWSGLWGRAAAVTALTLSALTLSGCPVYSSDQLGCYYATDCPAGYQCSFDGYCVAAVPFEEVDGGTRDGAILDGGTLDGGTFDSGT